MKPYLVKWIALAGFIFLCLSTMFAQTSLFMDENRKKMKKESIQKWSILEYRNTHIQEQLLEEGNNCQTFVYRTKLQAPPGDFIQLEGAITFTDNSVVAATSVYNNSKPFTSFLIHLNENGDINKQVQFTIQGKPTRIMQILPDEGGNFWIAGVLSEQSETIFVSKINQDFSVYETITWISEEAVSSLWLYAVPGLGISIATETNTTNFVYQLSSLLKLQWAIKLNRSNEHRLKGIFLHPNDKVLIGRSKKNTPDKEGYEMIELNKQTGAILNAWDLPQEFPYENLQHFTGFSNVTSMTGLHQKPNRSWQVWHKSDLSMPQSFNDRYYDFDILLDNNTTVRPSQGLDALAICNGTTGNLFFLFQNLNNDKSPTRSREITVPIQSRLKSFLLTADAGYQYGLDKEGGNEIWFIKTDSAGLIATCTTNALTVKYEREAGTKHESFSVTAVALNVQVQPSFAETTNGNLGQQIDCQLKFCRPKPIQDTCTAGFLKIMRSHYYGPGVYDGVIKNNMIFTAGGTIENFSSVEYLNTGLVGQYTNSGEHQKSYSVYANGKSVRPFLWPGNGDTMLLNTPVWRNDSLFYIITAINSNFDIIWSSTILSYHRFSSSISPPMVTDIAIDDDGNIYLVTSQVNLAQTYQNFGVVKLNREGTMQWDKVFRVKDRFMGIVTGTIGPAGLLLMVNCAPSSFTMLLDTKTGDKITSHTFDDNEGGFPITQPIYNLKIHNGKFYYLSSGLKSGKSILLASIFDEKGKPEKMVELGPAYGNIRANLWNGTTDIMTTFYDETTMSFKMHKIQLDDMLDIVHSVLTEPGEGYFNPISMMHTSTGSPILLGFRTPNNDPSATENFLAKFTHDGKLGNCYSAPLALYPKELFSINQEIITELSSFSFLSFEKLPFVLLPFKYGMQEAELLCKSDEKCNTILLSGTTQICDLSGVETFIAIKNNDCSLSPQWHIDDKVIEIVQRKGDTLQVRFKATGTHTIKARIMTGCSIIEDSLTVLVSPSKAAINLGSDTTLCPGDSVQLNAGAGYASYKWNTGSTDSTLWVSAGGKYFATVGNTCGAPLSDTIEIFMPTLPPLSAGSDSSICTGNTFQRFASDGFANYQWKNLGTQSVVSNSRLMEQILTTTSTFALTAANADGCSRFDTLSMYVISARPFSLGANQNICAGDTANFSAPLGYAGYLWNTGATTNSIKALKQGQYILTVTDTNGCATADTVFIENVFALPKPNLGADKNVCAGSSINLNPGIFNRYQWQNGSTSASLLASANASYSVQVWDVNGCTASDTMQIIAQVPPPSNFLPETDSLCQYEKLTLQASARFESYQWSTASSLPTIQVDKPGLYALAVTDNNGCTGSDTIRIILKTCMEGVYIPTAFTPNNDGKNDLFRPMVFGNVIKYEFTVFNRYGERIFTTNEPMQGWDGKWKGMLQPANAYAWMCSYQLEGGKATMERGMVMLIR